MFTVNLSALVLYVKNFLELVERVANDQSGDDNPHSVASNKSPPEPNTSVRTTTVGPGPALPSLPAHVTLKDFVTPEDESAERVQGRDHESNGVLVPLIGADGVEPEDAQDAVNDASWNLHSKNDFVDVAAVVGRGYL